MTAIEPVAALPAVRPFAAKRLASTPPPPRAAAPARPYAASRTGLAARGAIVDILV
jgi:hypothetical protein